VIPVNTAGAFFMPSYDKSATRTDCFLAIVKYKSLTKFRNIQKICAIESDTLVQWFPNLWYEYPWGYVKKS
jgi:hypothetical protein